MNASIHFKYRTVSDTSHDVVFQSQENAPVASVYLNKKKKMIIFDFTQTKFLHKIRSLKWFGDKGGDLRDPLPCHLLFVMLGDCHIQASIYMYLHSFHSP